MTAAQISYRKLLRGNLLACAGGNSIEVGPLKKKSKLVARRAEPKKPGPVGGRNAASGDINWSKVGRKRKNTDDSIKDLAVALKAVRERKGIPLSKLAKELKVAPATLIKFEEKGHAISVAVVSAIAEKLDCTLEVNASPKKRARAKR